MSPAPANPPLLALGSWQNDDTFWNALVERKKLPHFGYPMGLSPLRDRLALGPVVFAGAPDAADGLADYLAFIEGWAPLAHGARTTAALPARLKTAVAPGA